LNLGEVREQVLAAVLGRDESEPFIVVEPVDCSDCHFLAPSKVNEKSSAARKPRGGLTIKKRKPGGNLKNAAAMDCNGS
jgi:hypothetical protein